MDSKLVLAGEAVANPSIRIANMVDAGLTSESGCVELSEKKAPFASRTVQTGLIVSRQGS